jgi:uncharacterized membrane protein
MSHQYANYQTPIGNPVSTFGLSPNAASLLSYIWIPVTSIIVLITEKENRLVRFHAFQSLFLGLSLFAITIALSVVIGIVMLVAGLVSPYAGIMVSIVSLLVWVIIAFAFLGVWIMCLIRAYRGAMHKLPVVGNFAERMTNK